ncbi:DUF433 domain-containing protein [Hydrocarboniphaga sp.]|uniref:DUF433 domain-containing protein n=1 Tax=Hydrocarboniphaga sp. TaxID=2033016 RepID=UPI002639A850|nr:DUF433 domain-containing protein [Hydrocarboniphaga sp.]
MFTATEAAVLTRLPLKAVNNAIDKKTVVPVIRERAGQSVRLLNRQALLSLTLERRLADRFFPELRRQVFDALAVSSSTMLSLDDGLLKIDLRAPRRELAESLRQLQRARHMVVSDPEILGGEPVFRGTRVPVHLIAALAAEGSTPADLQAGYPRLTAEMIQLAPVYAAAYPQRGRPRRQPWQDRPSAHRVRVPLSALKV